MHTHYSPELLVICTSLLSVGSVHLWIFDMRLVLFAAQIECFQHSFALDERLATAFGRVVAEDVDEIMVGGRRYVDVISCNMTLRYAVVINGDLTSAIRFHAAGGVDGVAE